MLLCSSSFCQSFTLRVINYKVRLKKHLNLSDKVFCPSPVQFSCSVMSDSLQPHELQHARPACPSPTPRVVVAWWLQYPLFSDTTSTCLVHNPLKFWRHLLFSQILLRFYQNNLTINLLSGHCHLVCLTLTCFLDKLTFIFLNQGICPLCISV